MPTGNRLRQVSRGPAVRRPLRRILGALALALCVSGCSLQMGSGCEWVRVIRPQVSDTDGTLRQILVHNEKVRVLCPTNN